MKFSKIFFIGTCALFLFILILAVFKPQDKKRDAADIMVQEIPIVGEESTLQKVSKKTTPKVIEPKAERKASILPSEKLSNTPLPDANLIHKLFVTDASKLPIVKTITYTSRVPWLEDRCAWLADYAAHHHTSRHFIARSLNGNPDYFTQKVSHGDEFNVFREDKEIEFHIVVDLSRCKMWFYYYDVEEGKRLLLKTYSVGLGRKNLERRSGLLTPLGCYRLGENVAIYKPGMMGYFQEQKVEMIRVFGTRWIPFAAAVSLDADSPRGYGIHGTPWKVDAKGNLVEDTSHIHQYKSDGCIRMKAEDVEELFAIVITKPTFVHTVKDFYDAKLPGVEENKKID